MQELRAIQLMRNPTVTRDDVYKVINRYPFMFPTGDDGDLQQYQLLAAWPHHREGERDDNDDTRLRYSMGLIVGEDANGSRFIGHGGGGFGFSSVTRWYPEAKLAVVVLTNSEPDEMTAVTERLAAAVLPAPRPPRSFTGDASPLVGTYNGPGDGKGMVIEVTHTPQGIAFSFDGAVAGPLAWVETWTFRRGSELLTFRRSTTRGPATELRFDAGGDHFILKRQ